MFEKRANELMKKAQMIQAFGDIYTMLADKLNWECKEYHSSDDEHPDAWFTEPDRENMSDWQIAKYDAYVAVMEAIEKMAK